MFFNNNCGRKECMNETIGFIGSGNMGEALIKGMIKSGVAAPRQILASDIRISRLDYIQKAYGISVYKDLSEMVSNCTILVLAVKPQDVPGALKTVASLTGMERLLISIAAGVTVAALEGLLPAGFRVIRVMPNTPALILNGATAAAGGTHAMESDMELTKEIFNAVGKVVVVQEKVMDAVTGLSGSGPAYVFLFIEALTDAGVRMGLARDVAGLLAVQTVIGASRMVEEMNERPAVLKEMVTSPGGTTMAGLHILEKGAMRGLIMSAVEAATLRSQEMGKSR
jgi:pyrroline-5-carboxylate reductase